MKENPYIFPFLWVKGENREKIVVEIEKIKEAGIDEFVLESRTHPAFLEDQWWEDFRFILELTTKMNMRVWLLDDAHFPTGYANGEVVKHPDKQKRYIHYNALDVFSEGYAHTLNLNLLKKPRRKWSDQKRGADYYEAIEKNQILAIVAYPLLQDDLIGNEAIDLTNLYNQQDFLSYTFPKGNWRVFVVYETTENGGQKDYINMLDKASVQLLIDAVYQPHYEHFKEYFGNTFRGFFSDEPGFGNATGFAKDEVIGKKDMALPWSKNLAMSFLTDEKVRRQLPFLWVDTQEKEEKDFRLAYMNQITELYSQNFAQNLGAWCRQRDVLYIGHIIEDNNMHARLGTGAGHYFRGMKGQSMAGIDIISGQITIGGDETYRTNSSKNDGTFYQYCLPKLADSAALLEEEKQGRAFCELYGAYGWQLSIRNMKWILDSLLVRGINHFVPHAFSMADFPDLDSPPHFYAQGKNPQYPLFKKLMSYMGNMSAQFNDGKLAAEVAVMYHGEFEWLGDYQKMQEPAKELSQAQIDFLFVCCDWVESAQISADGFTIGGHLFEKLVIPYTEYLPHNLADFIQKLNKDQVLFIDDYPKGIVGDTVQEADFTAYPCCSLTDLSTKLQSYRQLQGPKRKIAVRRYQKKDCELLLLHNESLNETYQVTPKKSAYPFVYQYDGLMDKYSQLYQENLSLAPYETMVLVASSQELALPSKSKSATAKGELPFTNKWQICLKNQGQVVDQLSAVQLPTISELYPNFSGQIEYTNTFEATQDSQVKLIIDRVFDGCQVFLNDQLLDTLIAPPYQMVLEGLNEGINQLKIIAYTTADRTLQESNLLITMFEPMEPTGIVGEVRLVAYD